MKKPSSQTSDKLSNQVLQLGNLSITPGTNVPLRIALLLWGEPGTGKTTLAATAPGRKFWINFDPDGPSAIATRKDYHIADMSELPFPEVMRLMKNGNPLGLNGLLEKYAEFETVVVDSATMLFYACLEEAVDKKHGASRQGFSPSMEAPGMTAYGARTQIFTQIMTPILRITGAHKRHLIVTCHEGNPVTRKNDDEILYISTSLSDTAVRNATSRISEIWRMSGLDTKRRVQVRPTGLYKPMKSRMFDQSGNPQFDWKYDPSKPDKDQPDMTIAGWFDAWVGEGGAKLALPDTW
jgi:hypothetical protein